MRRLPILISLVLLLTSAFNGWTEIPLSTLRADSQAASEDPQRLPSALARIESIYPIEGDRPAVVQAYYASLIGLRGKYSTNMVEKSRLVFEAIDLMKGLAEANPQDIDIRFLRFSLYSELPAFFGVRALVEPDLEALLALLERKDYRSAPEGFQRAIIGRLLKHRLVDKPQYTRLMRLLTTQ